MKLALGFGLLAVLAACSSSTDSAGERADSDLSAKLGLSILAGAHRTQESLDAPSAMTTDGKNLYVIESPRTGTPDILRINLATRDKTVLATAYPAHEMVRQPTGIVFAAGKLYLADGQTHHVLEMDPQSGRVSDFAGSSWRIVEGKWEIDNGSALGSQRREGIDGTGADAIIPYPTGMTTDDAGAIYLSQESYRFCETANNCGGLRKIDIKTRKVTSVTVVDPLFDRTTTRDRRFDPRGLAFYKDALYVVDKGSNTVRRVDLKAERPTAEVFVGKADGDVSKDGVGESAVFRNIGQIKSDGSGSLYLTDDYFVRKIDIATRAVTTVAGTEFADRASLDGEGHIAKDVVDESYWSARPGEVGPLPGTLDCPAGLAVLEAHKLAVSEPCVGMILLANAVK